MLNTVVNKCKQGLAGRPRTTGSFSVGKYHHASECLLGVGYGIFQWISKKFDPLTILKSHNTPYIGMMKGYGISASQVV